MARSLSLSETWEGGRVNTTTAGRQSSQEEKEKRYKFQSYRVRKYYLGDRAKEYRKYKKIILSL